MSDELAFNINYPVVEITCAEAQCPKAILRGCGAVHRRHTGDATLTVVGTIGAIQRIASEIIPGWPDPVPPAEQPMTQGDGEALSAAELDCLAPGMRVIAGGFPDRLRNERVTWVKLHNGRWETARQERVDDNAGVSSVWLANNRNPMLDKLSPDP